MYAPSNSALPRGPSVLGFASSVAPRSPSTRCSPHPPSARTVHPHPRLPTPAPRSTPLALQDPAAPAGSPSSAPRPGSESLPRHNAGASGISLRSPEPPAPRESSSYRSPNISSPTINDAQRNSLRLAATRVILHATSRNPPRKTPSLAATHRSDTSHSPAPVPHRQSRPPQDRPFSSQRPRRHIQHAPHHRPLAAELRPTRRSPQIKTVATLPRPTQPASSCSTLAIIFQRQQLAAILQHRPSTGIFDLAPAAHSQFAPPHPAAAPSAHLRDPQRPAAKTQHRRPDLDRCSLNPLRTLFHRPHTRALCRLRHIQNQRQRSHSPAPSLPRTTQSPAAPPTAASPQSLPEPTAHPPPAHTAAPPPAAPPYKIPALQLHRSSSPSNRSSRTIGSNRSRSR